MWLINFNRLYISKKLVNGTHDQYDVVYVDFGNWSKVHSKDIHTILPDFAILSAQAIACSLSEVIESSK